MTLAEKALNKVNIDKDRFIYLQFDTCYYDTLRSRIIRKTDLADHLKMKPPEVIKMRGKEIKEYLDLCYCDGGKEDCYNTLDKNTILKPSETPEIHKDIEFLINNLCGNSKDNIDYLHRAILYKYLNINDVLIPAIVLYGPGGSGKGTFIKLLAEIFGQRNTQQGLGQQDLESSFSSYVGEKIIVEFREINTGNKFNDKKMLDKIKGFVGESRISVNQKFQAQREVDNIAWFIMSSNHTIPIQLDSADSGNRRFSIIKTGEGIGISEGKRINTVVRKKENVQNYLAWLLKEYNEVMQWDSIQPLDNVEKQNLENSCEPVGNLFFRWFEENYPNIYKLTTIERNILIGRYRVEIGDDQIDNDPRYAANNFNSGLSHKYENKRVKIRDKVLRGYFIHKKPAELKKIKEQQHTGEFKENALEFSDEKKDKNVYELPDFLK